MYPAKHNKAQRIRTIIMLYHSELHTGQGYPGYFWGSRKYPGSLGAPETGVGVVGHHWEGGLNTIFVVENQTCKFVLDSACLVAIPKDECAMFETDKRHVVYVYPMYYARQPPKWGVGVVWWVWVWWGCGVGGGGWVGEVGDRGWGMPGGSPNFRKSHLLLIGGTLLLLLWAQNCITFTFISNTCRSSVLCNLIVTQIRWLSPPCWGASPGTRRTFVTPFYVWTKATVFTASFF